MVWFPIYVDLPYLFADRLSSDSVVHYYAAAGLGYAAITDAANSDISKNLRLAKKWVKWEQKYAERGYRPLSLPDFIVGCRDRTWLDRQRLTRYVREDEKPVMHARDNWTALENFLGRKSIVLRG